MDQLSFAIEQRLPPTVHICIPPQLRTEALALSMEEPPVHPAWKKARIKGKHFVITTNELDDISELADFARANLEEPEHPLSKAKRQACQILLDRTFRHAELLPVGTCHAIAIKWRDRPLPSSKSHVATAQAMRRAV